MQHDGTCLASLPLWTTAVVWAQKRKYVAYFQAPFEQTLMALITNITTIASIIFVVLISIITIRILISVAIVDILCVRQVAWVVGPSGDVLGGLWI